jgi:uncharacterized cupin superfamily protein
MPPLEAKPMDNPDETRNFEHGKLEVSSLGSHSIGRYEVEPGWKWSTCVKPLVGTESCQAAHVGYMLQGRLGVRMDDGTEIQIKAGDAYRIEPGHDGWVEGDENTIGVEFESLKDYAKPKE